jgi:hypothetical protein
MASGSSETPPTHPETGDQPQLDDAPPVYDEATGILDVRQEGLNAQSKVAGQFKPTLPWHLLIETQTTDALRYT